jgi:hypothetical protein
MKFAKGAEMKNLLIAAAVCAIGLSLQGNAVAQYRSARVFQPVERVVDQGLANKGHVWAQKHASRQPWHGDYYNLQYGAPVALVVPPNSMMQQNYSWGVSQNTMTPIHHQYGPTQTAGGGGAFYGTPVWPSHTRQFGVYPVRAPW